MPASAHRPALPGSPRLPGALPAALSGDPPAPAAGPARGRPRALRVLRAGAVAWFVVATLGQWAFVAFIAAFFGGGVLDGDLAGLNRKPHVTGYVPGDVAGNVQFLGHALLGGLVTFAGAWQLVPALRRRWPGLHRWNGRLFLGVAMAITVSGLYLVWGRGSRLGNGSDLSITLNAALILVFSVLAWRCALRRDLATHRRHALRAWLLVNGVWFLRIGIMLTAIVLTPLGFEVNYEGAAFVLVSFASWCLPLAVAELYFAAERSPRPALQYATGGLLVLLAVATLAGSAAAAALMWWPVL